MKSNTITHFFGSSLVLLMALLADTVLAQDEKAIGTILVSKGLVQMASRGSYADALIFLLKIPLLPVLKALLKSDLSIPQ